MSRGRESTNQKFFVAERRNLLVCLPSTLTSGGRRQNLQFPNGVHYAAVLS